MWAALAKSRSTLCRCFGRPDESRNAILTRAIKFPALQTVDQSKAPAATEKIGAGGDGESWHWHSRYIVGLWATQEP
jgi:hypothetical protein